MTVNHLYPTTRPTLDLNFARQKRLDPRVTFTRGSTATYVGDDGLIKTAASNEARFDHDPATGESLGLLVEESRTNLFDQSEDLTTWTSSSYTKTNNQAISPDGTLNAGSLVPIVGTTSQSSGRTVTQSAGNYVCSVFAKPNGLTQLKIRFSGSSYQAFFSLTGNGSVTSQSNGTASISKRSDGWYRCVFAINDPVGETAEWQIGHNDNANVDGTNGFYVWGMQVEAGNFITSYIPTTSSTVTRSADVASMTGTNFSSWYNQSEGTVFADTTDLGYPANAFGSLWKIFASTSHTSGRNAINLTRYSGGALPEARFSVVDQNAVNQVDLNTTSPPTSARVKSAIGLQSGSYAAASHGNTVVTSSAAVPPTFVAADTLAFGQATNSTTQQKSCLVARLTYYPTRLTDSQLQELTR